jgi:hypothetical protein
MQNAYNFLIDSGDDHTLSKVVCSKYRYLTGLENKQIMAEF